MVSRPVEIWNGVSMSSRCGGMCHGRPAGAPRPQHGQDAHGTPSHDLLYAATLSNAARSPAGADGVADGTSSGLGMMSGEKTCKRGLEPVKKCSISRRDAEAQRYEVNNCFILFVVSAPLRLCARCSCLKVNFFTRSCPRFSGFRIQTPQHRSCVSPSYRSSVIQYLLHFWKRTFPSQ